MITLRPYQTEMIDRTRVALRQYRSVLLQAPTGAGKTALSAAMTGTATGKGLRTLFICHRVELITQTAETFDKVGIYYGFCSAGMPYNPNAAALVCGIDTLKNRLKDVGKRDLIIWDEAHHTAAAGWRKVREFFPDAWHVGLTATPERLDGKGLDDLYDTLVLGPSVKSLIDDGYLCKYRAFAPSRPQLGQVKKLGGDYNKGQLTEVMDGPSITGDAIAHYQKHAAGKRAVAFCTSVAHSEHVAQQFRAAGVPAVALDGTTDRVVRAAALAQFRRGEIHVLCNVDLFGEGFDLPAIEAAILLRPTQSLALFLQQVGRALRPVPGKDHAIILDHAGNIMEHGLPDDERDWTLQGKKGRKKKGEDEEKVRQCGECFHCHEPAPACPECGYVYPRAKPRQIEEVAGELEEIDQEQLRAQRKREQAMAVTVDDLIKLATAKGYKNPAKWAAHIWTARQAKAAQRRGPPTPPLEAYMNGMR